MNAESEPMAAPSAPLTPETHRVAGYTEASARDYWQLLKPRVMSLVVFTGLVGVAVAPGHIAPLNALLAILALAINAGAAGALNMWLERDRDALMLRTRNRPLPKGIIHPDSAFLFALALSAASTVLMGMVTNWLAAALLVITTGYYLVIYTLWLKPRTAQNIVIGGAAGAFPPLIGWAAVTATVPLEAWVLFGIIFLWTPPHFWALALAVETDYAKAKIPMLPNVAGQRTTQNQILLYALLLCGASLVPFWLGTAGWIYASAALLLGGLFIAAAFLLWRQAEPRPRDALRLFGYSIFYLFLLFALLLLDAQHRVVWTWLA